VTCLRARSPQELLEALPPDVNVAGVSSTLYQPHVDGVVLPEEPLDMIAAGSHNRVPFVVGANADETAASILGSISDDVYIGTVEATFTIFSEQVLAAYPISDYDDARDAYVHLTSDLKFICPARTIARAADQGQSEPVFRYFFTETTDYAPLASLGAFHGAELAFVFGYLEAFPLYDPPAEELSLANDMRSYWGNLADVGNPNAEGLALWETYVSSNDNSLVLEGVDIHMVNGVRTAKCDFWDDLFSWL